MHIGIFAERFVGRYGADRVCVILAEQLRQAGHRVTLVGVLFSRAVLDRFPGQTFRLPDFQKRRAEERTLEHLRQSRYYYRRHLPDFDVAIVGSYPFITAIPYLRTIASQVIFLDFGVVPAGGYDPEMVRVLERLRADRRTHLREATGIVAISEFIASSQSTPDCAGQVPVQTILLGADHLAKRIGYTEEEAREPKQKPGKPLPPSLTQQILDKLIEDERKLVLCLGRWEPSCYKNSEAAYAVIRSVMDLDPEVALLVLGNPYQLVPPPDLANHVYAIGLPSDEDMERVTRVIDAGISVSLWEGFNLPVVELQYQEKAVFALNLAAHPEVVVSGEQLCSDTEEMAVKLYRSVRACEPPDWVRSGAIDAWREKFCWQRFEDEFRQVLQGAA
jgi:hypothetical protein